MLADGHGGAETVIDVKPVPAGRRATLARRWQWPLVGWIATVALTCLGTSPRGYTVVRSFPHDTGAYTQGLVYEGGALYESTGRYGQSELRRVELATGRVLAAVPLPDDRFGEGLALLDGKLYQLTWKSGVGYVYLAETLALVDSFAYSGEGWGLATDGALLVMSDGTATLRRLDPRTFEVVGEVTVRDRESPLSQINELEYVRGELFANVYPSDWIVRIDPATGAVLEWIDLAGLLPERERTPSTDVLNGIAFDAATGHLLVTGKLWPALLEIRLTRPPGAPPS
jgi:glutamine cyclotransferase